MKPHNSPNFYYHLIYPWVLLSGWTGFGWEFHNHRERLTQDHMFGCALEVLYAVDFMRLSYQLMLLNFDTACKQWLNLDALLLIKLIYFIKVSPYQWDRYTPGRIANNKREVELKPTNKLSLLLLFETGKIFSMEIIR